MTEKEKAARGLLYDANYDESLLQERLICKELCWELNALRPSQIEQRIELLHKLFGQIGEQAEILSPFICDYGYNIRIGDHCFLNHNTVILDGAAVTFGNHVFVAPNCSFYTAGHPFDIAQRNAGLEYAKPITVEDNVWIGGNVVVLPGVTIGKDSVIGAGSVVTKDIPSGVLAVGNPCRVVRKLEQ